MNDPRHPCPCCGYRTLPAPAGETTDFCPVCCWESNDYRGRRPLLADAQQHYLNTGACEDLYRDIVRPPLSEEDRPPLWLSAEDLKLKIIAFIEETFENVRLGGGMTIHQQEVIDSYGSAEEFAAARKKDPEKRWQDVTLSKLTVGVHLNLIFFDPSAVRFYLPAFLTFMLQTWRTEWRNHDAIFFFAFDEGPTPAGYHSDTFSLLNENQLEAVAASLAFMAIYDEHGNSDTAREALDNGWEAHLPDFVRFLFNPNIQP